MAFNLFYSPHVGVNVRGTLNDEEGIPQPFAFVLKCKRLPADDIKAKVDDPEGLISDFLLSVVEGWKGVNDPQGKPAEYSEEHMRQLLRLPGVALMAFRCYLAEVGAKEKN